VNVRRHLPWLRPVVALLGAAAFVAGAVALFTIDNTAGSLFVVTVGLVLVLLAVLGDRVQLESFELLGARITVREVVQGRLQLAEAAGAREADPRSSEAHGQAVTLQKLVGLYELYRYVRRTQPVSDERTAALDRLAARMQEAGAEADFDPAEVTAWFHEGDDALRVIALNVMLARPECRDFLAVLRTVDEPRSLFEQYYGLRLASAMAPSLDDLERGLLAGAVERARRRRRFRRDAPLMGLSTALLSELRS
jgi:hypothetical protein